RSPNPASYVDTDLNGYAHSYPNPVHGEVSPAPGAVSNFAGTPPSAPSFNTTACRFAERDAGTAAHSASSPHSAADAYRFPAYYSGAAPVKAMLRSDQVSTYLKAQ